MSFGSNANLAAMSAFSNVGSSQSAIGKTLARLATAKRINSAADDAAGLSVASNLGSRADGVSQSMRNINDGMAMVQTADSSAEEVGGLLSRMRELAVQSSSGTLNDTQRGMIQTEFSELAEEVDRIAEGSTFNGMNLLDGSTTSVTIQVGEDGSASSQTDVDFGDLTSGALGISSTSVGTQSDAQDAIDDIDAAINTVNRQRSSFGASYNSLDSSFRAAESRYQNLRARRATSRMRTWPSNRPSWLARRSWARPRWQCRPRPTSSRPLRRPWCSSRTARELDVRSLGLSGGPLLGRDRMFAGLHHGSEPAATALPT